MEIGTLPPLGMSHEASFDEGEEEEELPLRPFPTTHSSGGSGAPAGPEISGGQHQSGVYHATLSESDPISRLTVYQSNTFQLQNGFLKPIIKTIGLCNPV